MEDASGIKETLIRAGLSAVISSTASYLMGENSTLTVGGMNVPTPIVIGAASGASSLATDLVFDQVYPDSNGMDKYRDVKEAALGLGVSGGATALILNREIGSNTFNAFALGASSYAAADYATSMICPKDVIKYTS